MTELRSKRDRSDTASLMTVDEITAEVESRRASITVDNSSDIEEWTRVDSDDGLESDTVEDVPKEIQDELEEEKVFEPAEDDDDDDETMLNDDNEDEDDEAPEAVTSRGGKFLPLIMQSQV
jgi:mitogen-activated protein kinase kinase kinase